VQKKAYKLLQDPV